MSADSHEQPPAADHGLRRVLIWTFIALIVSVLLALAGVQLVTHLFDRP